MVDGAEGAHGKACMHAFGGCMVLPKIPSEYSAIGQNFRIDVLLKKRRFDIELRWVHRLLPVGERAVIGVQAQPRQAS